MNALAEDQTLKFAPGLTVVYGDNGAGKTGYIRILKSACRARGQERILGNVVSGTSPLAPVVAIKYKVGTEPEPREWVGTGEDEFVSRVSVFDTQCAAVYLTEKTDVASGPSVWTCSTNWSRPVRQSAQNLRTSSVHGRQANSL